MQRIALLLTILLPIFAMGQSIKGRVYDTASKKGLSYTTVSLVKATDSSLVSFTRADAEGYFTLKQVPHGSYLLSASYVGFLPVWKPVSIHNDMVDVGDMAMTDVKYMNEVTVTAKRPPVVINGDTLEFNTENFKTQPNAVVEDMLKKMPGVTVDNDGTIRVNGQRVNRVLVNGKEFFTGDPKLATRNLNADAVDKVQVFERKSDQSMFTGVDDGNSEKAINLKLKKDKNNALFGRLTAGAGENERYDAQANVNQFKGEQQMSMLGMGNNTNRQGFSMMDYMNFTGEMGRGMRGGGGVTIRVGANGNDNGLPVTGMGQNQQGVAETYAGGFNYNDIWNKKTDINASLMASDMDLNTVRQLNRQYLFPGNNYNYSSVSNSERITQQQRVNMSIDHKFDSLHSIKITPTLGLQQNKNNSFSMYASETFAKAPLNGGYTESSSVANAINFTNNILFRKKFNRKGRTISANIDMQYNESESNGSLDAMYSTYVSGVQEDSVLNQINEQDAITRAFSSNITYTEPLGKRSLLEMNGYINTSVGVSDRKTYDFNSSSGKHDALNTSLSNSFTSNYTYSGGSMHYRTAQPKYNFTVGAAVRSAELNGFNKTTSTEVTQNFTDVLPDANFQYKFNQYKNLTLSYSTNTQQPSTRHLQPIADMSDPLNISYGNPNLQRSYTHTLNLNFFSADPLRRKNLFAFASINLTDDAIVTHENILPGAIRTTKPVNANGQLFAFASVNAGFPIRKLNSRLELSLGTNYQKNISFLNQNKNIIENNTISPAASWNFSVDNKIDILASARLNISKAQYSLQPILNSNYLQQVYNFEMTNYLPWGIVLNNTFNYTKNTGRADGFNIGVPFWNTSIAKGFLKNKRAEVKLAVNDVLNKNVGNTRNANQNYIEDLQYNVLKRYGLISFTYSLNKSGLQTGPRAVIRMVN